VSLRFLRKDLLTRRFLTTLFIFKAANNDSASGIFLELNSLSRPSSSIKNPAPPESTTPACFNTGSISGVFSSISLRWGMQSIINSRGFSFVVIISEYFFFNSDMRVSIVPSLGLSVPWYAVIHPFSIALRIFSLEKSLFSRTSVMPSKKSDNITPEHPRLLSSILSDISFRYSPASILSGRFPGMFESAP